MPQLVHYIPILTTVTCIPFAIILFRRWSRKPNALYLAWWTLGVVMYAVGTLTESLTTLIGWQEWIFRSWYISGALLGGAPLAQGTLYLLMDNKKAHRFTVALISVVLVAAICVLMSPINSDLVEAHRLSGEVFGWQWVRAFSPFINLYAVVFLVGGALFSAWNYWKRDNSTSGRMWGNLLIAIGAILPGIGGSFTRVGHVEVLYVTELLGILSIWIGYHFVVSDSAQSIHVKQAQQMASGQ